MWRIGHLVGKVGNYGPGVPVGHVLGGYNCYGQNRENRREVESNLQDIGHRQNNHERNWHECHPYPENHHREVSRQDQYDCR